MPPTLERFHVRDSKVEPFTLHSLRIEAPVPICFDSARVVSDNRMDEFDFLWKLDSQFGSASNTVVGSTDFVVATGFCKIHLTDGIGVSCR